MAKKSKKKNTTEDNGITCLKKDLIKQIAATTQNTVKATEAFYNAFEQNLFQALTNYEKVNLSPYIGKFVLKTRQARMGRNPQTGKKLNIPAKTVVNFKIASVLKQAVADLEII
ncbi:MAG: HU family DNA-binding protein ['Conium maculatum' witches'-broom phytoplasma]|nr:HU family DNA-binding protein ['Conium maculatum' witches'-broom phytoplasma]MEC4559313.1 HU family DNA-binding protein ['Conium maculatum' witches'-broom phytoplasma]